MQVEVIAKFAEAAVPSAFNPPANIRSNKKRSRTSNFPVWRSARVNSSATSCATASWILPHRQSRSWRKRPIAIRLYAGRLISAGFLTGTKKLVEPQEIRLTETDAMRKKERKGNKPLVLPGR